MTDFSFLGELSLTHIHTPIHTFSSFPSSSVAEILVELQNDSVIHTMYYDSNSI